MLADNSSLPLLLANQIDNQYHGSSSRRFLTPSEAWTTNIVSLLCGSLSVGSGLLALYWFYNMRRSFRHDIIMLLIQSDIVEGLWFMIFPAVQLSRGPIESSSAFCQASGFFLSLGIECADVAVGLLAVHTTLYLLRRGNGLYQYRRIAYGVFLSVPILLASLAFVNSNGYINHGEYCYLPASPSWTRLALSWGPRYVLVGMLFLAYGCIYFYVELRMQRFSVTEADTAQSSWVEDWIQHYDGTTSTVPVSPRTSQSYNESGRTSPTCVVGPRYKMRRTQVHPDQVAMELYRSPTSITPHLDHVEDPPGFSRTELKPIFERISYTAPHTHGSEAPPLSTSPTDQAPALDSARNRSRPPSKKSSVASINNVIAPQGTWPPETLKLHFTPNIRSSESSTPGHSRRQSLVQYLRNVREQSLVSVGATASSMRNRSTGLDSRDMTGLAAMRASIRRQIKLLFVYPLVYVALWAVPFVVHILERSGSKIPFALVLAKIVSLSLQGFADVLVFSLREKPWRHLRRRKQPLLRRRWWKSTPSVTGAHVGRTRDEMLLDGRLAWRRWKQEIQARAGEREGGQKRASPYWWDQFRETEDFGEEKHNDSTPDLT